MKKSVASNPVEGTSSNANSISETEHEDLLQQLRKMPLTKVAELMELVQEQKKKGEEERAPITYKRRDSEETSQERKRKHARSQVPKETRQKQGEKEAAKADDTPLSKKVSPLSPQSINQEPQSDSPMGKEGTPEEGNKKMGEFTKGSNRPQAKRIKMMARKGFRKVQITESDEEKDDETFAKYQEEQEEKMEKMKESKKKLKGKGKVMDLPERRRSSRIGLRSVPKNSETETHVISDDEEERIDEEEGIEKEKQRNKEKAISERIIVLQKLELRGERGFSSNAGDLPAFITDIIKQQQWENLCAQPPDAYNTLVIDFYGHLAFAEGDSFRLYGALVSCGEKDINAVYEITVEEGMEGNRIIENPTEEQMSEALQVLARRGAKWTHSARGVRSILAAELRREPAVWLNFIRNRICPTTHYTTVSLEKVMLLYCLFKGIKVNVGILISNEMKEIAKKTVGSLFFPSLITLLCRAAFIPMRGEIIRTKPMDLTGINVLMKLSDKKAQKQPADQPTSSTPEKLKKEEKESSATQQLKKLGTKLCTYFKYCRQRDEGMKAMFSEIFETSSSCLPQFPEELLTDNDETDSSS